MLLLQSQARRFQALPLLPRFSQQAALPIRLLDYLLQVADGTFQGAIGTLALALCLTLPLRERSQVLRQRTGLLLAAPQCCR
ncbi:MAG: hypothetical protein BWY63_01323 [Chloroflexi bacterium ADurb.Bin360]|nr:MAG: hypothetical protein BWY63_01323 [Chloroflexi bacterium ADurb.Bin360]